MASLSVGEVVHLFNVTNFMFQCHATQDERETLEEIANVATERTVDAFQVLMSGGRSLPVIVIFLLKMYRMCGMFLARIRETAHPHKHFFLCMV